MGILPTAKQDHKTTPTTAKRRSVQTDFANLKPLNPGGAKGFTGFRDTDTRPPKVKGVKKQESDEMDSDEDDDDIQPQIKQESETQELPNGMLSLEDAKRQGELAEGVKKIKV